MPTKFRLRPVTVEAMQYPGLRELADCAPVFTWLEENGIAHHHDGGLVLEGTDGEYLVHPGDWIVKGMFANFFALSPAAFAAYYVPLEEPE